MTHNTVLLDTSFFLRFLNDKDPLFKNADKYFRHFIDNKMAMAISTISIAEYCVGGRLPIYSLNKLPASFTGNQLFCYRVVVADPGFWRPSSEKIINYLTKPETMASLFKSRDLPCMVILLLSALTTAAQAQPANSAGLIEVIRKTEKQFETDLNASGAAFAFEKYAAPNAVIKRQNDSLVYGPAAIRHYYSNATYKSAHATWSPDYIDISQDGTMAYTYGRYQWKMTNPSGEVHQYSGVFHTVWKKQPDGSWKYVWD
jgi:ketosteroid isomerase-like protein